MDTNYATLDRGTVKLWKSGWNSPVCTVCRDAQSAVIYGKEIVVTRNNGSTAVYRITPNRSNAYLVRISR